MKTKIFFSLILFFCSFGYAQTTQQILLNPDFSQTNYGWTASTDFYYNSTFSNCCVCNGYAYLSQANGTQGNNLGGEIHQTVTIPANASAATITFCYSWTGSETAQGNDFLDGFLCINGCATNASFFFSWITGTQAWGTWGPINIPNTYWGVPLTIYFEAGTSSSLPSTVRVDEVHLDVTLPPSCTAPSASFTPSQTTITAGGNITTTNNSSGNPSPTYSWSVSPSSGVTFSPSNTATNPTITFANSGTYSVSLTASNSCSPFTNTTSSTITVNTGCTAPSASFTPSQTTITAGGNITTTNNSSGNPSPTYSWSVSPSSGVTFSPSNTATNPTITFANSGTYSVSLTASNSCSPFTNTTSSTITVNTGCTAPSASFTPSQTTITAGGNITTTNNSSGNPSPTYSWSVSPSSGVTFSPSNTATNPTITFANSGTYSVSLTASNSCSPFTNTTSSTITVNGGTTPVITVTNPNGGQSYVIGTPFTITATYTPTNITSIFNFDLSLNNGQNWSYLGGSWGVSGNVSLQFNPTAASTQCLVRVRTSTGGNTYQDVSNSTFTIVAPNNGVGFSLNQNISHLYWPFTSSNWDANPNSTVRNGWKGGNENGGGCGHGCGGHHLGDYFADDWNKTTGVWPRDCDSLFLAPLRGVVICASSSCTTHVCSGGSCGYNANKVTIRSLDNPNYAFKVLHFNDVLVQEGDTVEVGDPIGRIGSTGHSTGSHAHCTLHKNLSYPYNSTQTGLQRLDACQTLGYDTTPGYDPNSFAANFLFDAVLGGTGGSEADFPLSLSAPAQLCPGDSLSISALTGYFYSWNTGDTSQSIVVSIAGSYSVIVSDSLGNPIANQSVVVTVAQPQTVGISDASTFICSGGSLELFSSIGNPSDTVGDYELDDHNLYYWSTGSNSVSTVVTTGGTYYLTVSDAQGCFSNVDSILITAIPNPTQPVISQTGSLLFSSTIQGCTYQWYLNTTLVATGQVIGSDTIGSGVYTVAAINSNGCSTLSAPFVVTGLGELNTIEMLKLYPNPNKGKFMLSLKSQVEKDIEIACLNLLGEKVVDGRYSIVGNSLETEINLSSVAKGLYLVRITANGKSIYRKVIVTE
jgi:plastocyanin